MCCRLVCCGVSAWPSVHITLPSVSAASLPLQAEDSEYLTAVQSGYLLAHNSHSIIEQIEQRQTQEAREAAVESGLARQDKQLGQVLVGAAGCAGLLLLLTLAKGRNAVRVAQVRGTLTVPCAVLTHCF